MRLKTVAFLSFSSATAFNQLQPTLFKDGICSLDKNEKMSFKTPDGFTECSLKSCPPDKYNYDYPQCHYCCRNPKCSKGATEGMVQKRKLIYSLIANVILLILLPYPTYCTWLWLRAKSKKKHEEDHLLLPRTSSTPLQQLPSQQSTPPQTPQPPPQQQQQTTSSQDLDGAVSKGDYIVEITDSDEDSSQNIENTSVPKRYVQPFTDSFDSNEVSDIAITSEFGGNK
ncbi:uncharacterized protein LOC130657502 [Hydractinia symbiolongicarpus]|uniref:uncharacterized protein LOC130657502 n=1 Tax=Hydractinia symbiolongicarpus TaxID=13093 RepID=UPI00254EF40E|nr:uncharacterized protein LOC130657502 [Hydractinia symbiolongicarpus]